MTRQDVIVIGAGVNGLVAAGLLARSGRAVTVFDGRETAGGILNPGEFFPGFRSYLGPAWCHHSPADVIRDLALDYHGLTLRPHGLVAAYTGDGEPLILERDIAALSHFATGDMARFKHFRHKLSRTLKLIGPILTEAPPDPAGIKTSGQGPMSRLGQTLTRFGEVELFELLHLLAAPMSDHLDAEFSDDRLKVLLAGMALSGQGVNATDPASATSMIFAPWVEDHGAAGAPTINLGASPLGGPAAFGDALVRAVNHLGVEICCGVEVADVILQDGRTHGVVLSNGEQVLADAVISSLDVKRTFLNLFDWKALPDPFLRRVAQLDYKGRCASLNLALNHADPIPDFVKNAHPAPGPIYIAASLDAMGEASDVAASKQIPEEPWLEVMCPTFCDPDAAPDNKHMLSILIHHVPWQFHDGGWNEDRRDRLTEQVVDRVDQVWPGLREAVSGGKLWLPLDLEETQARTGGVFWGSDMMPDRLFWNRPLPELSRYRTPIPNFYLCGADTHPSAMFFGSAGALAAKELMKDSR